MFKKIVFLAAGLCAVSSVTCAEKTQKNEPKLVVNIVVSQMRYDYLTRFQRNYRPDGLMLLAKDGVNFTNARFNYTGNNTPAGLSTILTGANPETHGIVSDRWVDYTTNKTIDVIRDEKYYGVGSVETDGQYSPSKLTVATLGDQMKRADSRSKIINIALEPTSAIVPGGVLADAAYWFDIYRGKWVTSTYYADRLPNWIENYNEENFAEAYRQMQWNMLLPPSSYISAEKLAIQSDSGKKFSLSSLTIPMEKLFKRREKTDYAPLRYTPIGIDMLMELAKKTIVYENLGKDDVPDLLNIVIDPTRTVSETYGTECVEIEDTYYRLDKAIADIVNYIDVQLGKQNVLFIVTSDHGSSDTFRERTRIPSGAFSIMQFRVLMNGFLNTQYGSGEWVVDYNNRNLYINRRLVFERSLNLEDMQSQMASFAMQFRGVAQAVTATSLQNNYFADGAMRKIQSGYYPKNSGDLVLNFMPGWIEETDGKVSLSGTMYEYDTHVPLLMYGAGLHPSAHHDNVDMTDIAPTVARMLGISKPEAATGKEIQQVISNKRE